MMFIINYKIYILTIDKYILFNGVTKLVIVNYFTHK